MFLLATQVRLIVSPTYSLYSTALVFLSIPAQRLGITEKVFDINDIIYLQ